MTIPMPSLDALNNQASWIGFVAISATNESGGDFEIKRFFFHLYPTLPTRTQNRCVSIAQKVLVFLLQYQRPLLRRHSFILYFKFISMTNFSNTV